MGNVKEAIPVDRDQAVLQLRERDPEFARHCYFDENVSTAADRFFVSGEFREVLKLVRDTVAGGTVLDLGAGNGIASYAFVRSGAARVISVEPSTSTLVGQGAIKRLASRTPIEILSAYGEHLPVRDETVDVVYTRAVLHHAADLVALLRECARAMVPDGILIASREHVVDDEKQLHEFLDKHPLHSWTQDENAYPLDDYASHFETLGFCDQRLSVCRDP
jgi:SAM-dependent methyltransferase